MLIAHVIREKGAAVHTLPAEATLEQAAKQLHAKKVGALVVLDADNGIVGVFSERDLVREIARRGPSALATATARRPVPTPGSTMPSATAYGPPCVIPLVSIIAPAWMSWGGTPWDRSTTRASGATRAMTRWHTPTNSCRRPRSDTNTTGPLTAHLQTFDEPARPASGVEVRLA